MRTIRHWTPRYIWDRMALYWDQARNPDSPWLTRAMIDILDTWLRPSDVGFEFGSGRSTSWIAKRVRHLTSIEHDPSWYAKVRQNLIASFGQEYVRRVNYQLCEDERADLEFTAYVNAISLIDETSLDFCLVDGVARDDCALACLQKLKPGGILIIDNANWYLPKTNKSRSPHSRGLEDGYASAIWRRVGEQLSTWRGIWTTDGIGDTAFWVKPIAWSPLPINAEFKSRWAAGRGY